jgi:hypothetical protein
VITIDRISALAPDRASLDAARKLLKPASWPLRGRDPDAALIWGECQGSGSAPYRVAAALADLSYKCTCPSRKFPCKHALALMWQEVERPDAFATGPAPDWVMDWAAKRKPRAAPEKATDATVPMMPPSAEPPVPQRDDKAEARAAAQRDRLRASRETAIADGLDELDRWLADRLDSGLAGFPAIAHEQCRMLAKRLVDAKAPGIARLVDEIPGEILSAPPAQRTDRMLRSLGRLHLIAAGYRNQDRLPKPLAEDIRRTVGWTVERAALLDDETTLRVAGLWRVAATTSEVQVDGIRRIETWLARIGPSDEPIPDFALLLDFVPVSAGSVSSPFLAGETFAATLAFYPSAAPLRAIVAERGASSDQQGAFAGHPTMAAALDAYDDALVRLPLMESWPLAIRDVAVVDTAIGLVLADRNVSIALPIGGVAESQLLPLLGQMITAVGLWDGNACHLLAADTPLGPWHAI